VTWRWLILIVPLALAAAAAWFTMPRPGPDDGEWTRERWKRLIPPKDDDDEP